jgi:ferritin-like metal-binding protein YciE
MISNLQEVYFDQLRDLYSAENQLIAALPEMVSAASNEELRDAFADHFEETQNHLVRLEQVFADHGITPNGEDCEAMRGLVKESRKHISQTAPGDVRDAILIAAANRIEHYEIAGYGVAKAFASVLGYDEAADLLDETLQEEGKADKTVTALATGGMFSSGINEGAIR